MMLLERPRDEPPLARNQVLVSLALCSNLVLICSGLGGIGRTGAFVLRKHMGSIALGSGTPKGVSSTHCRSNGTKQLQFLILFLLSGRQELALVLSLGECITKMFFQF